MVAFIHILVSIAAGAAYLVFIVNLALLYMGLENVLVYRRSSAGAKDTLFGPYTRAMSCRALSSKTPRALYLSFFMLAAVYFFLPVGALPAFIETRGDFLIVILLLVLAQALYLQGLRGYSKRLYRSLEKYQVNILLRFTIALTVAYSVFAWYALITGIPGDILSVTTYARLPLFKTVGAAGHAGLVFFFISIAAVSPSRGPRRNDGALEDTAALEAFDSIRSMLGPSFLVSLFLTWNSAGLFAFSGAAVFVGDFVVYWLMVFAVQIAAVPAVQSFYAAVQRRFPAPFRPYIYLLFSAAGAAFFMAELYL